MGLGLSLAAATMDGHGQQVDKYSADSLGEQLKPLVTKAAAGNGSASETLQKYGVDYTMLAFRSKSGGGEVHEKFADIFIVMEGKATLLSGGELENPATSSPGELHGNSVLHPAQTTTLEKGDIVHIPANTPHQMLLPKDGTITYFVVKVKEKD
jgi:mannose-6-phosphate isomerase-like protein (cupin superfamily)